MIGKDVRIGEGLERPAEVELAPVERVVQISEKEPAEEAGQHPDRQKEPRSAGDPAGAIDGETTAGDDAMEMRVMDEGLPPRVQHGEESDLGTQVLRPKFRPILA